MKHTHNTAGEDTQDNEHPRAPVPLPSIDEIDTHRHLRYLSASEAMWDLCGFDHLERSPAVHTVHVHGPDYQPLRGKSDLQHYFDRPEGAEFDLLLLDYLETFRFGPTRTVGSRQSPTARETHPLPNGQAVFVVRRTKHDIIAVFDWITPTVGDHWYIRLLLQHRVCRSFNQLRTVDTITYDSFEEAAHMLGLTTRGVYSEAETCVTEAIEKLHLPATELRALVVTLFVWGDKINPMTPTERTTHDTVTVDGITFSATKNPDRLGASLVLQFFPQLTADFMDEYENETAQEIWNRLVSDLQDRLNAVGYNTTHFGLPDVTYTTDERAVREQKREDKARAAAVQRHPTFEQKLNNHQRAIYEEICAVANKLFGKTDTAMSTVNSSYSTPDTAKLWLIDAPAGRGKTFLAQRLQVSIYT